MEGESAHLGGEGCLERERGGGGEVSTVTLLHPNMLQLTKKHPPCYVFYA